MADEVKALGMALDMIDRQKTGKPAPMATCPRCDEPLIATVKFRGKEFVCVACKALWEFLQPKAVEATPELHARYDELKAQWDDEIAQQEMK